MLTLFIHENAYKHIAKKETDWPTSITYAQYIIGLY
jgi:hypothetical protein